MKEHSCWEEPWVLYGSVESLNCIPEIKKQKTKNSRERKDFNLPLLSKQEQQKQQPPPKQTNKQTPSMSHE